MSYGLSFVCLFDVSAQLYIFQNYLTAAQVSAHYAGDYVSDLSLTTLAWLRFDETEGQIAHDSSEYNNWASAVSPHWNPTGGGGKCLVPCGPNAAPEGYSSWSNGQAVGSSALNFNSDPWTVEAWLRRSGTDNGNLGSFWFSAGVNQGLNDGFVHLGIRSSFDPTNPNRPVMGFYADDQHAGADNEWPVSDTQWHHVVVVVAAPVANKHWRSLYTDALLVVSAQSTGKLALPGNTTFAIGGAGSNLGTWKGDIDEVRCTAWPPHA